MDVAFFQLFLLNTAFKNPHFSFQAPECWTPGFPYGLIYLA